MWCESKYFTTFVSRKLCTETQEAPFVVSTTLTSVTMAPRVKIPLAPAHTRSRDVPAGPVPLSWSTFTGAHCSISTLWETTECIQDGIHEHRFCTSASGGFLFIFYLFGREGLGKPSFMWEAATMGRGKWKGWTHFPSLFCFPERGLKQQHLAH